MDEKTDVYAFLCYSFKDQPIAQVLVSSLNAKGVKVWRDVDQIEPGARWEVELEHGLVNATAIIYLASENSSTSQWMAKELDIFIKLGRPVFTVIVDTSGIDAVPVALREYQWLNIEAGADNVASRIAAALRKTNAASTQAIAPSSPKSKGYVFLSYAEEDSDFLEILRPLLIKHKYAYWDFQESDRDYHGQFIIELENIIQDSAATISVLSESWKKSKWALREFLYSEEISKPIFLLRAKAMSPTLATQGTPYIDFVVDVDAGYKKLHRELQKKGL